MATTETASPSGLRATSAVILLSILVQFALAIGILTGTHGMLDPHGFLGYLTFLACGVATFLAWKASKVDPLYKGAFFHAAGMFVLSVVQIGMAEMTGAIPSLKWVHVVLGILMLGGAFGLFSMLRKRPARA